MATERPTFSHLGDGPCAVPPETDYTKRPGRYCGPNHRKNLATLKLENARGAAIADEERRLGRRLTYAERNVIWKRFSEDGAENLPAVAV